MILVNDVASSSTEGAIDSTVIARIRVMELLGEPLPTEMFTPPAPSTAGAVGGVGAAGGGGAGGGGAGGGGGGAGDSSARPLTNAPRRRGGAGPRRAGAGGGGGREGG